MERLEDIDGYKYHFGQWALGNDSSFGNRAVCAFYAEAENEQVVLDILAQTKQAILA